MVTLVVLKTIFYSLLLIPKSRGNSGIWGIKSLKRDGFLRVCYKNPDGKREFVNGVLKIPVNFWNFLYMNRNIPMCLQEFLYYEVGCKQRGCTKVS